MPDNYTYLNQKAGDKNTIVSTTFSGTEAHFFRQDRSHDSTHLNYNPYKSEGNNFHKFPISRKEIPHRIPLSGSSLIEAQIEAEKYTNILNGEPNLPTSLNNKYFNKYFKKYDKK